MESHIYASNLTAPSGSEPKAEDGECMTTKRVHFLRCRNPRRQTANSNTIQGTLRRWNGMLWIRNLCRQDTDFQSAPRSFEKNAEHQRDQQQYHQRVVRGLENVWVGSNNTEGLHIHDSHIDQFVAGSKIEPDQRRADYPWIRTIVNEERRTLDGQHLPWNLHSP